MIVVAFVVHHGDPIDLVDMKYEFLNTRREGPVEHLTLNRPEVRNAFNEFLGFELTHWAEAISVDDEVRVVVMDVGWSWK